MDSGPLDPREAYRTQSEWWGWHVSPAALVLHVCHRCGVRSERLVCELCEGDLTGGMDCGTDFEPEQYRRLPNISAGEATSDLRREGQDSMVS